MNTFVETASLALSAFLSATLLPGTSELVLAALAAQGTVNWGVLLLVATLANTAGSTVNWWLGTKVHRFSGRRWFPVSPQQLQKAEVWFQRYGVWSLLLSWLPLIGDGITLAAGALRVKLLTFVALVAIAKAARYAVVLWGVAALV